jgi:hypothetical protein
MLLTLSKIGGVSMRWRSLLGLSIFALLAGPVSAADLPLIYLQGGPWSQHRYEYYGQDQGSVMIPLAWLQALKQPNNGPPFLADNLARYGYLSDPAKSDGLPVGFTTTVGPDGVTSAGMTCSACHTRQITAQGNAYRIDGGPAFADYQGLVEGLDAAVQQVLATDKAWKDFVAAVHPQDPVKLRGEVNRWHTRLDALVTGARPKSPWGPGRLDAVGMIFNRLTGLDLGPESEDFIIPGNIRPAEAPTRYPFLWNAPVQDKTQWPGFADNGSDILGLLRNVGEEFGVFGDFRPTTVPIINLYDFLSKNSANFDGLNKLEQLIRQIPPPAWPWPIDPVLAAQGKQVYQQSGCGGCHWLDPIPPGIVRFPDVQTWATPIQDVGTDTREYDIMGWTADTGSLKNAWIPEVDPLKPTDSSFNILKMSVLGSIIGHEIFGAGGPGPQSTTPAASQVTLAVLARLRELKGAFRPAEAPRGAYESRVLQGIWAAAPYLHNGSVPTLVELLKPAAQRVSEFKVGPAYDTVNVGLAAEQPQSNYTLKTTDCSDRNSGNSRCGHEGNGFGTNLSDQDKKALLEFLKTL